MKEIKVMSMIMDTGTERVKHRKGYILFIETRMEEGLISYYIYDWNGTMLVTLLL